MPAFMLQNVFQSFFVTAEKPHLGLYVVIAAGVTNMVLDFLFVGILGFGLAGAALATVCGEFFILQGKIPACSVLAKLNGTVMCFYRPVLTVLLSLLRIFPVPL